MYTDSDYYRYSLRVFKAFTEVPDLKKIQANFKMFNSLEELLLVKSYEGSIESTDIANDLIRRRKDEGNTKENY